MSADFGVLWIRKSGDDESAGFRIAPIAYWDSDDDSVRERAEILCMNIVRLGYEAEIVHEEGAFVYTQDDIEQEVAS